MILGLVPNFGGGTRSHSPLDVGWKEFKVWVEREENCEISVEKWGIWKNEE